MKIATILAKGLLISALANVTVVTNNTNNYINTPPTESSNKLFNNQFGCLSDSDWITNQSIVNNEFYSYDTSHANYTLSDGTIARNAFMVNDQGMLILKSDSHLSNIDKINLNNTKDQIIRHRQVTPFNISNEKSNSQYVQLKSKTNINTLQYLQFGGSEKHIDISSQRFADKVENNNNLSETLGLYYIAKAVRSGVIDIKNAHALGHYFINQSSLMNKVSYNITNAIINILVKKNSIFNFVENSPMKDGTTILYENYAMDYILDRTNELVKIYFNIWN